MTMGKEDILLDIISYGPFLVTGILTGLKLFKVINWPWWIITLPIIMFFGLVIIIYLLYKITKARIK